VQKKRGSSQGRRLRYKDEPSNKQKIRKGKKEAGRKNKKFTGEKQTSLSRGRLKKIQGRERTRGRSAKGGKEDPLRTNRA